jgi:uncharacterized SAM-binding protein YcdF (DUF218 family)
MFLFLSKLLPLLIYPLGLSIVLLSLALWFLRKRPRLARGAIVLSIVILWLSSSQLLSRRLVGHLESQNLPQELQKAEAIVLLGGATKSANPPRPWVDLSEEGDRLLHTARLYRQGKAPKVILSGGRIQWNGAGQPESQDMAEVLEFLGVPASAMLQDPNSLNTYQNAVNVKAILEQQQIRRILLVTSAMHMPRSLLIFRKLGIEAIPAPTDFLVVDADDPVTSEGRLLSLLPDGENLRMTNRALKEYIGLWIYRLRGWA